MYLKHLKSDKISNILKVAYTTSENLKTQSWVKKASKILNFIITDPRKRSNYSRKYIINLLRPKFEEQWKEKMLFERKLRSYVLFKTKFEYEEYLNLKNVRARKAIARIRTSAHSLAIETGRYSRPVIPADRRFCRYCPEEVENEIHFMLFCKKYEDSRKALLQEIERINPNFKTFNDTEKFIYLMKSPIVIAELTGEFMHKNMQNVNFLNYLNIKHYLS